MSETTARIDRERRRAELARALRNAMHEHDVTIHDVADATGASPTVVQRWTDHREATTVQLADVPALPPSVARALLQWAGSEAGLDVTERGEATAEGFVALMREVIVESAEAQAELGAALADGTLDRAELVKLNREVSEALHAWVALANMVKRSLDGLQGAAA